MEVTRGWWLFLWVRRKYKMRGFAEDTQRKGRIRGEMHCFARGILCDTVLDGLMKVTPLAMVVILVGPQEIQNAGFRGGYAEEREDTRRSALFRAAYPVRYSSRWLNESYSADDGGHSMAPQEMQNAGFRGGYAEEREDTRRGALFRAGYPVRYSPRWLNESYREMLLGNT